MDKTKLLMGMAIMACLFSSCAALKENMPPLGVGRTAQAFFDDLQRSRNADAYGLLGRGLSQRISFDQFDQFMRAIRGQWGRIESDDTELLPFHRRVGEEEFIPLNVSAQEIKRYVFDVKFEDAEMNFDLTIAPEGGGYKIVWFSVWGSNMYLTPQIKEKIEELFSGPGQSQAQ